MRKIQLIGSFRRRPLQSGKKKKSRGKKADTEKKDREIKE